jgi:hypothetical protein
MSLDYVELEMDRTRKIRFSFKDLRDLETRLGGIPFQQVLDNLQQMHLSTLVQTLHVGLRGDDGRLNTTKVEDLIESYLKKGGSMVVLLTAIAEAMEKSGITGRPSENESERPT